jgi:dTDP-4-amino-4,6-dideoxygalactose transaminase
MVSRFRPCREFDRQLIVSVHSVVDPDFRQPNVRILSLVSRAAKAGPSLPRRCTAVPLLDLQRQYAGIRDEVLAAIERVCSSQQFILGAEVEQFEREVAEFIGVPAGVGCASGTDALWLALTAAGVQPGDDVITSAFSFFASASSIARAGARPVFVDIDPSTFNLDPRKVAARLRAGGSYKIRVLLPVHLYGQCADLDALREVAEEFKLVMIEDAAQAIGAKWRHCNAGSLGIAAAFSFYPTKNLGAYGDAGLVTTVDALLAERMRNLRNHGSPRRYLHEEVGCNCRMDAIQGAVLRVKLKYVAKWNEQRREHARIYDRLFAEASLCGRSGTPITLPQTLDNAHHVFHQYVIRAQRRNELRRFLAERQIASEIYYPTPLHLQPSFAYLGYLEGDLPESEKAAREVLALPMFPELTDSEQVSVVDAIAEFYS